MSACLTCGKETEAGILYCRGLSPCFMASLKSSEPDDSGDVLNKYHAKRLKVDDLIVSMVRLTWSEQTQADADKAKEFLNQIITLRSSWFEEDNVIRFLESKYHQEDSSHRETMAMYQRCREARDAYKEELRALINKTRTEAEAMREAMADVLCQVDPDAHGKSLAAPLLRRDIHAVLDPFFILEKSL